MSLDLEVHDLTATLRGTDPERPVIVGTDGLRVVMLLDPTEAGTLAKVLARFEARFADDDLDFPFDRPTWLHAMVDLLAAQAETTHRPVPVYTVPASKVVGR